MVAQLCALAPEVERSLRVVQVAAVLRWSGSLFTAGGGRGRWELDVAGGPVPGWLRGQIGELSRHTCGLRIHPLADGSAAGRVRVRLTGTVAALAGQVGLLDRRGRLVRGLSSAVVADPSPLVAAAVWRGAFLARGRLSDPGRGPRIEVLCPNPEVALALIRASRRLGFTAHCHPATLRPAAPGTGAPAARLDHADPGSAAAGPEMVVVSGEAAVTALLSRIGAPHAAGGWRRQRRRRPGPPGAAGGPAPAGLAAHNQRRAIDAATDTVARAARALDILAVAGDPPRMALLIAAGRLRVAHPGMALEQLGVLAEPPVSKDAIAGRLRRLVRAADTRAVAFGIPDSSTALPGGRRVPEPGRDRDRDVG